MQHLPHENYMTVLIARDVPEFELLDELRLLRLTLPDRELIKYLYRNVPRVAKKGSFRATAKLKEWAQDHELRTNLLNKDSKKVKAARNLCFHSKMRELVNLGLLNPNWNWSEVKTNAVDAGARGLTVQLIKDYQQLFWNFSHMSSTDKSRFFMDSGASDGQRAAADGFTAMGFALDHGIIPDMTDTERLKYMMDLTVQKFARDTHGRRASAQDMAIMMSSVITAQNEMRKIAPVTPQATIEYDGGTIDMMPTIDHLDLLEDDLTAIEGEVHDQHRNEDQTNADDGQSQPNAQIVKFVPRR